MVTKKTSGSSKRLASNPADNGFAQGTGTSTLFQRINRIAFVIDRSGSMQGILKDAVDAYNENLRVLKEQAAKTGQSVTVSLYIFDDEVECLYFDRSIDSLGELPYNELSARNMTALFDAAGEGIDDLRALKCGTRDDVAYLVNVITDGEENRSKRFHDGKNFDKLAYDVQKTDMWTLTFLVPKGGKKTLVDKFGVPDGNVMEWSQTAAGIKEYAAAQKRGLEHFFSERAAGKKSTKSFFTTDLSNVSVKEVKRTLDTMSDAKVFHVTAREHDMEIRDFIKKKTARAYVKGTAFYELSKTEKKVQDYKDVLIMEEGKDTIYGGDAARQLLGLPDSDTKIVPGDHGRFRIFIQSTSVNRKVKQGTSVIYRKAAAV